MIQDKDDQCKQWVQMVRCEVWTVETLQQRREEPTTEEDNSKQNIGCKSDHLAR